MTIVFKCSCGRGFKVPDEAAGKKVKCSDCGEAVQVPAPKAAKQKVKAAAPADEDDYGMDFGLPEDDLPTELPPRTRDLEDDVPRKKKSGGGGSGGSRRKSKGGTSPAVIVVGILAVVGLVGVGGFFLVSNLGGGSSKPLEVTYTDFTHERGGFTVEYPSEWEKKDSGNSTVPPWASFEDGTGYISVRTSVKGAALADIANSTMSMGGLGDEQDAEQAEADALKMVHDFLTETQFQHDYSGYEETPGELFQTPYGSGWLVEFTGSEGFGGKQHAYRLTLKASSLQQLTVLCKCPNNRWERYEPVFKHVLQNLGHGGGDEL